MENESKIIKKLRDSGSDIIGNIPWGIHICQFYHTKEDLLEILVPYFKAGLKNNEYCLWVTADPLNTKEATSELEKVVNDLDYYIKKGQIEILDYHKWYTRKLGFGSDRIIKGWMDKEKKAIEKGFDGLRQAVNTFNLDQKDWDGFIHHEGIFNSIIGENRILAICSYCLDLCNPSEIIDVVSNYQLALIRRKNKWNIMESKEHKKTVEDLKVMEDKYKNLLETSPNGIITMDLKGMVTKANPAFFKLSGYSNDEIIGKHFTRLPVLLKRDLPKYIRLFATILQKGDLDPIEYTWKHKSGNLCWGDGHFGIIRKNGRIVGVHLVVGDITKRKIAEMEIIKQRDRAQRYLDIAGVMFVAINSEGNVTLINRKGCEILGYNEEEIIGKNWFDNFIPDRIKETILPVSKQLLTGVFKTTEYIENPVLTKSGEERLIAWHNTVLKDNEGKIIGHLSSGEDITEKKKALTILKESEERYRTLFENSADGILFADVETKNFLFVNPSACRMFGYNEDDFINLTVEDIHPKVSLEYVFSEFNAQAMGEKTLAENIPCLRKDGTIFFADFNTTSSILNGHECNVGFARDITERKFAEEKIKKQYIELQNLNRIKTEFLNNTSHELRTPMTTMKGYLQMLINGTLGELNPQQKQSLEILLRNTDRLDRLVQDILDTSQMESGTMKYSLVKTDIKDLFNEIINSMGYLAKIKNIILNLKIDEDVPEILVDHSRIRQVLDNLVNNAIKFSPEGSTITMKARKYNDDIVLEVEDTGIGIPDDKKQKIFEPFYQIDSGVDRSYGGTGLGLSICRGIIDGHGGRIGVKSNKEKGSTFYFTIPITSELDNKGFFEKINILDKKIENNNIKGEIE